MSTQPKYKAFPKGVGELQDSGKYAVMDVEQISAKLNELEQQRDQLAREVEILQPISPDQRPAVTDELKNAHTMIVRLCRVARVAGREQIADQAIDLIRRQGYSPSPLRDDEKLTPSAALTEQD